MKYTLEIIIDLPREKVIELFDNSENLMKWQPGLESFEHISGEPGKEGAKSKMVFQMKKRRMEMVETIIKRNLPEEFHGTYDTNGVLNIQNNYFEVVDENHTRWVSESEFRFNNFMMKMMGVLMPGAFKKQSYKFMKLFKEFAERTAKEDSKKP